MFWNIVLGSFAIMLAIIVVGQGIYFLSGKFGNSDREAEKIQSGKD